MIKIIAKNFFTFFNMLNFALAALVIAVGSYENALFLGVVISNLIISAAQEIRAKVIIDRLSVTHAPPPNVAVGDEIAVKAGEHIYADCVVLSGECEVNESLLTGEAEPVLKKSGDKLMAGSYAVSGGVAARVVGIGADSFAGKLTAEAKAVKLRRSEIFRALDKVVKLISVIVIPVAAVLFYKSVFLLGEGREAAVVSVVAAVIGMIPEGLVLLTGVVFAVTAVRLARIGVMPRDLYAAEPLAKMSVLCLDKTGTITEGVMLVERFNELRGGAKAELSAFMSVFAVRNPTSAAIAEFCGDCESCNKAVTASEITPFSSERKFSSAVIGGRKYVLKAGEDLDLTDKALRVLEFTRDGERIAVIGLCDKIRDNIAETLDYFYENGVDIKVISGDSPETVAQIAAKAGVRDVEASVYGRVDPVGKREIVAELRKDGAVVGMVGDGVNDILAIKQADIGVALKSGSDAARRSASLVLLNDDLSALTKAIEESRNRVNSLQKAAVLFLTKTAYSFLLAAVFVFAKAPYPLVPIQMTLISGAFIGIPAFFLALRKDARKVGGKFLNAVLRRAVPFGAAIAAAVSAFNFAAYRLGFGTDRIRVGTAWVVGIGSFAALINTCIKRKTL